MNKILKHKIQICKIFAVEISTRSDIFKKSNFNPLQSNLFHTNLSNRSNFVVFFPFMPGYVFVSFFIFENVFLCESVAAAVPAIFQERCQTESHKFVYHHRDQIKDRKGLKIIISNIYDIIQKHINTFFFYIISNFDQNKHLVSQKKAQN